MPNFIRTILSVVAAVCILGACKKEYSYEGMPVKTEPVKQEPETYHFAPYTQGSTYNYMYNTQTDTFYYTVTVTGDTAIYGKTYSMLYDGLNKQYISYDKGGYYLYEKPFNTTTAHHPEAVRPFLYDYFPMGQQWNDTVKATTFKGDPEISMLNYTIIQARTPKTVLAKDYSRVVGVKQDAYILGNNRAYPIGHLANFFYADSVGFVERDSPTDTIRLISYDLK